MTASGLLQETGKDYFSLTDKGREAVNDRSTSGAKKYFEGKSLFSEAVKKATEVSITAEEFAKLWGVVQEGISEMFLDNGLRVTEAISSILENQHAQVDQFEDLSAHINKLKARIVALGLRAAATSEEIAQSIVDVLHDKTSRCFDWLTQVSLTYVGICTLGLEPKSQHEMEARIREIDFILDTDVLISSLSVGEPEHRAIVDAIKSWKKLGGRVYCPTSVLEEAAYHAAIAESEYKDVEGSIAKYSDQDAQDLLVNAFVRGYRKAVKGSKYGFNRKTWSRYIGNFLGDHDRDYSQIQLPVKDSGVEVIDDRNVNDSLSSSAFNEILGMKTPSGISSKDKTEKAQRDGRLCALLAELRKSRAKSGGTAVIISSSPLLRAYCRKHPEEFGAADPVMTVASWTYLLSMLPGVKMPMTALRKALFDSTFGEKMSSMERAAFRIVKASDEFPAALMQKHSFKREMQQQITRMAQQRGQSVAEMQTSMDSDEEIKHEILTDVIAKSLDEMPGISRAQKKVSQLEAELRAVKGELDRERKKRK